ncbi:MAG: DNA replication/repair protein RecF [Candidatus Berkelbacteria bacterium]
MIIKSIKLTNFRNWLSNEFDFSDVTIFIGPNGRGKTNVLEAVWLISTGRSWRTNRDAESINWENDFAKIEAEVSGDKSVKIDLVLQKIPTKDRPQPKILKVNSTKKRLIDLLGILPAVLFSPESLEILDGAPGLRRKFLDVMLSQIDKKYALNLLSFNKVLKERNKLLQMISLRRGKPDELEFWDQKLVEAGRAIIAQRTSVIKFFNQTLDKAYSEISGQKETLKLSYKASVEEDRFMDILTIDRDRDISQNTTSHGPHRDDLVFLLDGRDITTFASRGEYRTALVALKMAELEFMSEKLGQRPILLLDDIFSELDHDRRMHLAKIMSGQQTIITTTDLDHIEKSLQKTARIVEIGKIDK